MQNVLVTGAGGYIGSTIVKLLLDGGHRVLGVDRYFFGRELLGADILSHNLFVPLKKDIRALTQTDFEGVDAVFDLAGLSNDPSCDLDPKLTYAINCEGSAGVARGAKKAGVHRYVFASSCSAYGGGENVRLTESSPLNPISSYAEAKIKAEEAVLSCASRDFTVTVLRNATVYGLSRRMRFDLVINMMTLFAWRDRKIFILGGGRQWRPIVHVADVARAFVAALGAESDIVNAQVFNVGSNGQNYQVFQLANIIKGVMPEIELVAVPEDSDRRSYNVAFDKIEAVLDFKTLKTPVDGVIEIKAALDSGSVDATDPRTVTLKYYKYLLDAERVIRDVAIDGRIF